NEYPWPPQISFVFLPITFDFAPKFQTGFSEITSVLTASDWAVSKASAYLAHCGACASAGYTLSIFDMMLHRGRSIRSPPLCVLHARSVWLKLAW
ncbi:MAG: hypothetical protein V7727_21830, partial [Sneathiella sp.]